MASIVDPYIGFVSYQKALLDGSIRPTPCESHPELFVMHDEPEPGVQRLTYAFNSGTVSKAYAVYIQADFLDGKPCFGVGYATAEHFRNQGLATFPPHRERACDGLDRGYRYPTSGYQPCASALQGTALILRVPLAMEGLVSKIKRESLGAPFLCCLFFELIIFQQYILTMSSIT